MTLYCQDCGATLDTSGDGGLGTISALMCPVCHTTFKRGPMTSDEFVAWLAFPPNLTPDAA